MYQTRKEREFYEKVGEMFCHEKFLDVSLGRESKKLSQETRVLEIDQKDLVKMS